jgi:hypothetical protein
MTDPKERLRRVANGMGRSALHAGATGAKNEIAGAFPKLAEFFGQDRNGRNMDLSSNPFDSDEDDDGDECDYDYDDDFEGDENLDEGDDELEGYEVNPDEDDSNAEEDEDETESFAFEHTGENSADDNLLLAVAAYRAFGTEGEFIAQNNHTGITFYGNEKDFKEFCDHKDMNASNWKRWDDPSEIFKMDHDPETLEALMTNHEEDLEGVARAKAQFEGFHWGDASRTVGFLNIPGLNGEVPLTLLGVGREICYGAKKEGGWVEYYHLMGEESKAYPMVYALGENTILIHGGNMRIEDRGIVD